MHAMRSISDDAHILQEVYSFEKSLPWAGFQLRMSRFLQPMECFYDKRSIVVNDIETISFSIDYFRFPNNWQAMEHSWVLIALTCARRRRELGGSDWLTIY